VRSMSALSEERFSRLPALESRKKIPLSSLLDSSLVLNTWDKSVSALAEIIMNEVKPCFQADRDNFIINLISFSFLQTNLLCPLCINSILLRSS